VLLFWAVHVAAVAGIVYTGWSWRGAVLAGVVYGVRMVVVTAGYHRYFAHRAFKTSRLGQFLLALGAQSAAQGGVIWWASHHRWHHKYSDGPEDVHSPARRGFWYAHIGWLYDSDWNNAKAALVPDLTKYPELRFISRDAANIWPTVALALAFLAFGGMHALVWGYFVSTVLLWHGSFSINSLAHLFGKRRYATRDDSRNNWLLAAFTTGEGWHNNHHRYPGSARQGLLWWEIDVTYYVLRVLSSVGLIWDLRQPPRRFAAESGTSSRNPSGA
jgi:stearoyl-CoA desaturase (Delta-9 desaturase)